jgi:hypothetical protein
LDEKAIVIPKARRFLRHAPLLGGALLACGLGCASSSGSTGSSAGSSASATAGAAGSGVGGSAGQGTGGTGGPGSGNGGQSAAGGGGATAAGGMGATSGNGGAGGTPTGGSGGLAGAAGSAGDASGGAGLGGQSNGGVAGGGASGAGGESVAGMGGASAGAGGGPPREFAWTTAEPCPLARFEANGAVVSGELWVLGGFTGSNLNVTRRVDIYDPEGDSWRQGPDLPGAETHMAVVTLGNDIVVAGGFTGAFGGTRPPTTDAVYRLPFGTTQWTAGPALPNRGAGFAWALLGTSLHVAGGLFADGNNDSPYHYVWDTAGPATWTMAAELPNPRNHGGGAAAGGLFYAIAGRHQWDENAGNTTDVHSFDPGTGVWTPRAAIPTGRSEIGASTLTLTDGRILVIGGSQNGVMPNDDVLVYDPAQNGWTPLPKLPAKRKGAVAAQIGERIIVTTGSPTSTDPIATTYVGCCL